MDLGGYSRSRPHGVNISNYAHSRPQDVPTMPGQGGPMRDMGVVGGFAQPGMARTAAPGATTKGMMGMYSNAPAIRYNGRGQNMYAPQATMPWNEPEITQAQRESMAASYGPQNAALAGYMAG